MEWNLPSGAAISVSKADISNLHKGGAVARQMTGQAGPENYIQWRRTGQHCPGGGVESRSRAERRNV